MKKSLRNASRLGPLVPFAALLATGVLLFSCGPGEEEVTFDFVPKAWDEEAFQDFFVPLAHASANPVRPLPVKDYYKIKPHRFYKSYPIYHPDHEPEGYLEELRGKEPEPAVDFTRVESDEDWIRAGQLIFEAPTAYDRLTDLETVRNPRWYKDNGLRIAADGTFPMFRYVIREKGKVEVGEMSCATCHIRILPDGGIVQGGPGEFPLGWLVGNRLKFFHQGRDPEESAEQEGERTVENWGVPWIDPEPRVALLDGMSFEDIVDLYKAGPPGVQPRTGIFYQVQVPDLIGLEERRFFDRTGHRQHRGIGDLMRYSALAQVIDTFNKYGDHDTKGRVRSRHRRYTDAQLYAVARYLYSLEPPPNPNPFDELAEQGKVIFDREECFRCHEPPLYSNNKLSPVEGFKVPEDHPQRDDIMKRSVGTDPGLALYSRRGTGLYKVPSLRGLWYRGPLQHSGAVLTLEEWFDPARIEEGYVRNGFAGTSDGPVAGHEFGLDISEEDRTALIAFLRTL